MRRKATESAARLNFGQGLQLAQQAPLDAIAGSAHIRFDDKHQHVNAKGWLALSPDGYVWVHPKRLAEPGEWARVLSMAYACLGFGLVRQREPQVLWEIAALLVAERFCQEAGIGIASEALLHPDVGIPVNGEEPLFRALVTEGCDPGLLLWYEALCGKGMTVFRADDRPVGPSYRPPDWKALLADGIARSVGKAIEKAGGWVSAGGVERRLTPGLKAQRRLVNSHPLLGALAIGFALEEDPRICQLHDIRVAAIDVGSRTIWINPAAGLNEAECLFVFAHELLHAGLNHCSRRRGRDALLWNVACDFVINGWLIDMAIGAPPVLGLLHDPEFQGQSAEEIYDQLARDMRRARKLATLRGPGMPDLLGREEGGIFVDAEAYCRRALYQGMERCLMSGRGFLPAGLVEEIRSLAQPPIPWDVRLAYWFDEHFPPPERHRSYARPSRRQASTPDIPRPSIMKPPEEERQARVFGVILDTSGSMEPKLLGKAIGAIASYAQAREVFAVRLVYCDATAYDAGWLPPESLLERIAVKGRGGTVLQPGVECLRNAARRGDFPPRGPVLVITDGYCEDQLQIDFEHAFLVPEGHRLPFTPRGEVFWVR
ncbi:MAG TPA: VWA-like domain-containing protein [Candidatus Competibacter sp.]|nr:peptidase [Candidatus Competibacteraceae bacterium]HRC72718.1 VWA-like domain-containing protein [Candidatus Competibacter sp.]